MSETQNKHEKETDAEPTPGPWDFSSQRGQSNRCYQAQVWGPDGESVAILEATTPQFKATANARLIAAAGTAAQEAKEMGYDPVAVVEALPEALKVLRDLLPLARVQSSIDHTVIEDVLASAEGRDK